MAGFIQGGSAAAGRWELAWEIGVPGNRVTEIVNRDRAVSAATAALLGRRLGTGAGFRLNLRMAHDLEAGAADGGDSLSRSHGAVEKTRTSTGLPPQAPQACASTIPPRPLGQARGIADE